MTHIALHLSPLLNNVYWYEQETSNRLCEHAPGKMCKEPVVSEELVVV